MFIQHYEECHLEKLPCWQDEKGPKIQSLREKIAEVETRERELYEEARYFVAKYGILLIKWKDLNGSCSVSHCFVWTACVH